MKAYRILVSSSGELPEIVLPARKPLCRTFSLRFAQGGCRLCASRKHKQKKAAPLRERLFA